MLELIVNYCLDHFWTVWLIVGVNFASCISLFICGIKLIIGVEGFDDEGEAMYD